MPLTKQQRELVFNKYNGKCAYCGCQLQSKWHADHIQPIVRNDWIDKEREPSYPERDNIDNMNPTCVPCNIDKHSMSIDVWRGVISRSNQVLERDNATFRRAMRYGLVELKDNPVVFYFETLKEQE